MRAMLVAPGMLKEADVQQEPHSRAQRMLRSYSTPVQEVSTLLTTMFLCLWSCCHAAEMVHHIVLRHADAPRQQEHSNTALYRSHEAQHTFAQNWFEGPAIYSSCAQAWMC